MMVMNSRLKMGLITSLHTTLNWNVIQNDGDGVIVI